MNWNRWRHAHASNFSGWSEEKKSNVEGETYESQGREGGREGGEKITTVYQEWWHSIRWCCTMSIQGGQEEEGDFLRDQNKMGLNRLGRKILTKNDDIPSDDFSPWVSKYSLSRVRLSLIACMLSIPKKTIYWEQQKQFNVSQISNNKIVKKNKADLRGSN